MTVCICPAVCCGLPRGKWGKHPPNVAYSSTQLIVLRLRKGGRSTSMTQSMWWIKKCSVSVPSIGIHYTVFGPAELPLSQVFKDPQVFPENFTPKFGIYFFGIRTMRRILIGFRESEG